MWRYLVGQLALYSLFLGLLQTKRTFYLATFNKTRGNSLVTTNQYVYPVTGILYHSTAPKLFTEVAFVSAFGAIFFVACYSQKVL